MQPLLLVVLALCAAPIIGLPRPDYSDDYNDEDVNPWQPEPLKPAPWQAEPPRSAPSAEPQAAVVPIPGIGQIVGVRNYKTIAGRPINAFLGVRYGQVGSGLARFQAAKPANLHGRIEATVQSPNCAQFPELERLRESESRGENVDDCLTLNIYAPEGARDLPVLVFVHGEMLFDGGAEEAQPDYVLEKDVLLVSINYRLAPFGFLSALSDELPGNVALSDLHLALEWLHRNLAHFGGNPGQVTLAGQAGGATLVHALSLSGRASELFQQLILQSGTALNPYLIDENPLETLNTFARLVRCPNPAVRSLAPLYDCLAALPTSQLVSAFEKLFVQNEPRGLTSLGGFKLVVGDRLGYLPLPPAALAANASNSVPTIVGAAKDASAFILSRFYSLIVGLQSRNVSDYIDVVLQHTAPPSEHRIWKQWALREIFTPDQEYSATPRSVTQGLLELSNIILYRAPVINSIRQSYRSSPVYLYTFDYRGEHHRFGHLNNPLPFGVDASLSDDSVYLFPYPEEASRLNPVDRSLSRALVTMWVNFAVSGVPNPNSGVWPRATSEYGPFLRFTNSRQNMLELDPHFGEGINLPNFYNGTISSSSVAVPAPTRPYTYPTYPTYPTTTTTTTTTTTRRPYVFNPYANWQSRQPHQTWRPANPDYVKAQEERQAQFIREQQLRAQREREQRWQEQKQRDNQNRGIVDERQARIDNQNRVPSQDPREQQRRDQEQQQREQEEQRRREQIQRAQQQRERAEQQERERQQREQQERERQEREQQEREQQEREQQERERQEREQQEREQQEREQQERERDHPVRNENPNNELQPYPSYDDHLRNHQDESPESTPDRSYDEDQESEQQRREQQQREQEERLEEERLQQEREREQQPEEEIPYLSYEDYLKAQQGENPPDTEPERNYNEEQDREQQQREQHEREQQVREQQEREQQEREQQEREQQEREQQERDQQEREPQPDSDDPRNYPSYDEYLRAQQARQLGASGFDPEEEQNREQGRRDELDQEQEVPVEENPEDADDQEPTDPANDPSSYPSYEAYVRAQEKMREEEEERDREQEARERAEEEQEESHQDHPGYSQLRRLHNEPQHIKLMHRQQRRRQ